MSYATTDARTLQKLTGMSHATAQRLARTGPHLHRFADGALIEADNPSSGRMVAEYLAAMAAGRGTPVQMMGRDARLVHHPLLHEVMARPDEFGSVTVMARMSAPTFWAELERFAALDGRRMLVACDMDFFWPFAGPNQRAALSRLLADEDVSVVMESFIGIEGLELPERILHVDAFCPMAPMPFTAHGSFFTGRNPADSESNSGNANVMLDEYSEVVIAAHRASGFEVFDLRKADDSAVHDGIVQMLARRGNEPEVLMLLSHEYRDAETTRLLTVLARTSRSRNVRLMLEVATPRS